MDGTTVAYKVNELTPDPRVPFDPKITKSYVTYAHRIAARGLVNSSVGGGPVTESGNIDDAALAAGTGIHAGVYEARLAAGTWFRDTGLVDESPTFLETIVFRFTVTRADEHYHLPIKLTPWGLSVWRGR